MTTKFILINTDTHVVVPREPTHEMVFAVYNCKSSLPENEIRSAIAAAPPLTTPPVLRWEDRFLILGKKFIVISIAEVKDGFIYQFYKTKTLEQARRAAEKALGFPDGLIIDESN